MPAVGAFVPWRFLPRALPAVIDILSFQGHAMDIANTYSDV
jgi:hypothetical protein